MSWASVGEHNLHKIMWSTQHNKTHAPKLWYIWHKCLRFEHKNCSKVPDDLPGTAPNWEVKSKLWVNGPTNNHVIKTVIFFSVALMLLTLNLLSCHSNQDDKKYKGSMFWLTPHFYLYHAFKLVQPQRPNSAILGLKVHEVYNLALI